MRALLEFFADIADPRPRATPSAACVAIAAGAILCGMRGYKAIEDWAQSLGPRESVSAVDAAMAPTASPVSPSSASIRLTSTAL